MIEILLFLVGIVVGAMNAVAGGGILLGFPVMIGLGVTPIVANATSHIIVLPGLITSAYGYRKYLRKVPRSYALLLIPCSVGAVIGAWLLRHTSSSRFEEIAPALVIFAVILFAIQPFLHFHLHKHLHSKTRSAMTLIFISLALLPVAIYGGYFGAGLGFILLAFLGFTKIHDVHQMNA